MSGKLKCAGIGILCLWFFLLAKCAYAIEPEGMTEYRGIDVSEGQGDIDFEEVASAGIELVYIKSSEGSDYVDPYFEQNYERARDADLQVGFYHYVTARTISQAQYQANFFVTTISEKDFEGKLAMDFEDLTGLTNEEINEIASVFAESVEELSGKEVVVYSDASNATDVFNEALTQYSLWIAEYDVNQPSDSVIWETYAGWQYSDTGSVSGIDGSVDLDIFYDGMLLDETTSVDRPSSQPDSSSTTITYIVKTGNTLSQIARLYNTTVAAIVQENNITNPNLIFPGETLRITISNNSNASSEYFIYIIKPGDTLSEIAFKYRTTVNELVQLNGIRNPNAIFVNERIRVPRFS